jgi:glycosyltransferase involved in cell wall biosynthesis
MTRRLAGFDVIHLNFIAPRSRSAYASYAAWPTRVLYTAHSDQLEREEGVVRRSLRWVVDRATLLRVHSLAGVTEHVRLKEGRRFGLPPHRSRTIFNGVDTRRFHPRPRSQPGGPMNLITVANLVEGKGVQHLLRALAQLRSSNVRLRVVGDGPELQPLRELAVKLGICPQTEFLGLRSDVEDLLGASDIYIQPTLVEAFGLAIAEAMACGCAVVASRVGGIPELIEHGRSGLLVNPGDEAGLAEAINHLLENPALRKQLGDGARQRVCERFELSRAVRQHLDWCEESAGYVSRPAARLTAPDFPREPRKPHASYEAGPHAS